jgi:hypothetical protein
VTTATDGAGLALGDATGSAVVAGAEPTQAALTSITMAAVARVGPPGQRDRVVVLMLGTTPVTGRFDTCPSSCAVDDHLVGSVTMSVAKRLRPRDGGVARPATHLQSEVRRLGGYQLGCRPRRRPARRRQPVGGVRNQRSLRDVVAVLFVFGSGLELVTGRLPEV